MEIREEALRLHREWHGKIEIASTVSVANERDLAMAYTPGVAEPCKEIHETPRLVYDYTRKWNMVAIVTDGSAVLGLGDIGPEAGLPVMEGKAVLFKRFGGVDAFPICLASKDVEEIIRTVRIISPGFGGINLEDISAPRCFEIERRLQDSLDIPVFHDDQHGTAIVTLAAMMNALKIVNKELRRVSVVVNGSGAAGIAITKLLMSLGLSDVVLCDRQGAIYRGRDHLNPAKDEIARLTNRYMRTGSLEEAVAATDVFIGVSGPDLLMPAMVRSMNREPVVFALANPTPEIAPEAAKAAGARVVGTGRSDYPNQINNVLAFPGLFRGALDVRARLVNDHMKVAAAEAIAGLVSPEELREDYILPKPFDPRVGRTVADAVRRAARESGVARS